MPSFTMRSSPSAHCTSSPPAVKVPLKTAFLAFWLMLTKPPMPMILSSKPANVDVASGIDLAEGQEREVEAAAVVEVKLVGLIDQGVVVLRGAGIHAGDRCTTDEALLVRERHPIEDALLRSDRGDTGRMPAPRLQSRPV